MSRTEMMLSYVPLYYHSSGIFKTILGAEGAEFDLLRQNTDGLRAQFFVDTATWGLEFWEREFGLTVSPELAYEERRSRVKGKLRGLGRVDMALIKSVAEAYANGETEVGFDGSIKVKFTGIRGIPLGLDELKSQLGDVVPAHLPVVYEFTYLTWHEFDMLTAEVQESMTWGELEVYRPFSEESEYLYWDELDLLVPSVQESMTWDELETFEPMEGI